MPNPEVIEVAAPYVEVVVEDGGGVTVEVTETVIDVEIGTVGPQGVPGPIGGYQHTQAVAMGTWTITVPAEIGRIPSVEAYVGGERVVPDVMASSVTVTLTFATPVAGVAILT